MLAENKAIFDLLDITKYHEKGFLGQGRKVVVLDSMFEGNHQQQIVNEGAEIAPSCVSVYLSRHLGDIKASVDWIFDHKDEIDAINCSWHSMPNPEFERLETLDIPVIAASGNEGDNEINYPATLPWVISVGAWSPYRNSITTYSNWGTGHDCVAPIPYWRGTTTGEAMTNSGTSFAAPVITYMLQLAGIDGRAAASHWIATRYCDVLARGYDLQSGWGIPIMPELEEVEMAESRVGKLIEGEWVVKMNGLSLSEKAIVVDGRTFLPVRALAETGCFKIEVVDGVHKTLYLG